MRAACVFLILFLFPCGHVESRAATGELKWKFQTGGPVSSPAISREGTIYVASGDSCLYALDADGSLKWKHKTTMYLFSYFRSWLFPVIGPDGTIYISCADTSCLHALNPDGSLKWKYKIPFHEISSPAIGADGTVYVMSSDCYFYALNQDGTLKWRYQTDDYYQTCSTAIGADGTVYVGIRDCLFALNPDGSLKWKYCKEYYNPIVSLALDADGSAYFTDESYLYKAGPDGTLQWKFYGKVELSPAIARDGTIYFGDWDYSYLFAFYPDGKLKWEYQTILDVNSSPALAADGTIYAGCRDGFLYALNPDGTLKWRCQLSSYPIESSPAIGDDGTIYLGSDDGCLYAINSGASSGLARSPWPKSRHDNQNTGRAEALPPLPGDVNRDGQVDLFDILAIVRFALGQNTPTEEQLEVADLNSDGKIDILDVVSCVSRALGKTALLAGYSGSSPGGIDAGELMADLSSLGADRELIGDVLVLLAQRSPVLPKAFSMGQNAPNPFNPATTVSYAVPQGQAVQVALQVYDLRGRLLRTLVEEERQPGTYSVSWDGRDDNGRPLASGVYLYRIQAGQFTRTRKMVLLK